MSKLVAIDPGLTGGLALIDERTRKVLAVADMPLEPLPPPPPKKRKGKKKRGKQPKRMVCGERIGDLLCDWKPGRAIIERVGAMPKQGVSSTFKFGTVYGIAIGAVRALQIPVEYVSPAWWKAKHGLIGTHKDAARVKAIKLHPEVAQFLSRKKDGGKADAILIGTAALVRQ